MVLCELPGDTLRRFIGSHRELTVGRVAIETGWGETTVYNLQSVSVATPPSSWRLTHFPFERFTELVTAFYVRLAPGSQVHADFHVAFVRQAYYQGFGEDALKPDYVPPALPMPSPEEMRNELVRSGIALGRFSAGAVSSSPSGLAELNHYLDQMAKLTGIVMAALVELRNALPPILPDSGDMRADIAEDQRRRVAVLARRVALSVLAADPPRKTV